MYWGQHICLLCDKLPGFFIQRKLASLQKYKKNNNLKAKQWHNTPPPKIPDFFPFLHSMGVITWPEQNKTLFELLRLRKFSKLAREFCSPQTTASKQGDKWSKPSEWSWNIRSRQWRHERKPGGEPETLPLTAPRRDSISHSCQVLYYAGEGPQKLCGVSVPEALYH